MYAAPVGACATSTRSTTPAASQRGRHASAASATSRARSIGIGASGKSAASSRASASRSLDQPVEVFRLGEHGLAGPRRAFGRDHAVGERLGVPADGRSAGCAARARPRAGTRAAGPRWWPGPRRARSGRTPGRRPPAAARPAPAPDGRRRAAGRGGGGVADRPGQPAGEQHARDDAGGSPASSGSHRFRPTARHRPVRRGRRPAPRRCRRAAPGPPQGTGVPATSRRAGDVAAAGHPGHHVGRQARPVGGAGADQVRVDVLAAQRVTSRSSSPVRPRGTARSAAATTSASFDSDSRAWRLQRADRQGHRDQRGDQHRHHATAQAQHRAGGEGRPRGRRRTTGAAESARAVSHRPRTRRRGGCGSAAGRRRAWPAPGRRGRRPYGCRRARRTPTRRRAAPRG